MKEITSYYYQVSVNGEGYGYSNPNTDADFVVEEGLNSAKETFTDCGLESDNPEDIVNVDIFKQTSLYADNGDRIEDGEIELYDSYVVYSEDLYEQNI